MISISECSLNDEELLNAIRMIKLIIPKIDVSHVHELYVNGVKKYLIRDKGKFYIINLKHGLFSSFDEFRVDGNNTIDYLSIHGTNIMLKDGIAYSFNNDVLPKGDFDDDEGYFDDYVGFVEKSVTMKESDEVDTRYASYNASICYLEYNFDSESALFLKYLYQASFDGYDKIREAYCNMPIHVNIVRLDTMDVTKDDEEYFLTEWDRNSSFYNNVISRIVNVGEDGSDGEYQFYYSKPVFDEKGRLILWNVFTSDIYYIDSLNNRIKRKGFEMSIPKELIDLYNGESEDYLYCKNILDAYNKYFMKDVMVKRKAM